MKKKTRLDDFFLVGNSTQSVTTRRARFILGRCKEELAKLFDAQYPYLNVGGFYNPSVVYAQGDEIEFRCHYDGFTREDDSWSWFFTPSTREFWN